MAYQATQVQTQLGQFLLVSCANQLVYVGGPQQQANDAKAMLHLPAATVVTPDAVSANLVHAFQRLVAGEDKQMDPRLYTVRGTAFQQAVYATLRTVPYGQTWTYTQLAAACHRPTAVRAVAHAVAQNPLLIIQPCHRIVPQSGGIGQYSGGVALKRKLLDSEGGKCVN